MGQRHLMLTVPCAYCCLRKLACLKKEVLSLGLAVAWQSLSFSNARQRLKRTELKDLERRSALPGILVASICSRAVWTARYLPWHRHTRVTRDRHSRVFDDFCVSVMSVMSALRVESNRRCRMQSERLPRVLTFWREPCKDCVDSGSALRGCSCSQVPLFLPRGEPCISSAGSAGLRGMVSAM